MAPAVSFAKQILPLFTQTDIDHMSGFGVMLADYSYMSQPANAAGVLGHLNGSTPPIMPPPPEGPWPAANIALFQAWISGGYQP
jgi:hypothetical protein